MTICIFGIRFVSCSKAKRILRSADKQKTGKRRIDKAQELHPALMLDLSMPVVNGLDAARILKRLMPNVPLVMLRKYNDAFSEQEARAIGSSAFLVSKSEQVSVLVDKVRSLLYDLAA
jgi:DNA-binding NarL/FixJ family response regulator